MKKRIIVQIIYLKKIYRREIIYYIDVKNR